MTENTALKHDVNRIELRGLIFDALKLADEFGLSHVAIHLDAALVALTGHGVEPPQCDDRYR